MKANENGMDRGIRVVLGIIALAAAVMLFDVMDGAIAGIIVAAIGAILLLTGIAGFCPAYKLVGLSTCQKGEKKECCGCGSGGCDSE